VLSHRRSQIGDIPLQEINALELDFLFAIDFDLGVHPADYAACTADLRAFAAAKSVPADAHLPAPQTAPLQAPHAGPAAEAISTTALAESEHSDRREPGVGVAAELEAESGSTTANSDADSVVHCGGGGGGGDDAIASPPPSGPGPAGPAAAGCTCG
jgi:hypothetical protein